MPWAMGVLLAPPWGCQLEIIQIFKECWKISRQISPATRLKNFYFSDRNHSFFRRSFLEAVQVSLKRGWDMTRFFMPSASLHQVHHCSEAKLSPGFAWYEVPLLQISGDPDHNIRALSVCADINCTSDASQSGGHHCCGLEVGARCSKQQVLCGNM